jgi:hypothetical protein
MPRKQRLRPRDAIRQLAADELEALGGTPIDHTEEYLRWKLSPVAFLEETQILSGPPHPRQVDLVRAAVEHESEHQVAIISDRPVFNDLVVNKTRQVGMSWLWMSVELWALLFHPTVRLLNASRKLEEVDDGGNASTARSLHGRIRQMYNLGIPPWLHRMSQLSFKHTLVTTKSGGFAYADTATPDVGRGGTYDMALLDEFAHVDWSKQVWAAVSQACKRGKIANSTPRGRGNEFARLWMNFKDRHIRAEGYHWTQHPVYSVDAYLGEDGVERSPWYDLQCQILGAEDMIAQELDMSLDRSVSSRVFPEFRRERHLIPTERNPHQPLICSWDYGYAGSTSIILAQIERLAGHIEIQVLDVYENQGLHIDEYVPVIAEWENIYGPISEHVGDPAGLAKSLTSGKGPVHALAEHGIHTSAPTWLHRDAIEGIRLCRVVMNRGLLGASSMPVGLAIHPKCDPLIDSLENTHYPVDTQGERLPGREMPADNEWTHMSDSFRYLVHYICRTYLGAESGTAEDDDEGTFTKGAMSMRF